MARGVNKVILIGNLGQDPEVRHLPSGNMVANFNIATTESWMDKNSGQRQEKTEWHKCNVFNKLAEISQQYLKKGSRVYVEGKLATRKWTDQQGVEKYSTEIKVLDLQMLDSKPQGGQGQQQGGYQQPPQGYGQGQPQNAPPAQPQGYQNQPNPTYGQGQPPAQQPPPQQNRQAAPPPQQPQQSYGVPDAGSFDDFDDEIPF